MAKSGIILLSGLLISAGIILSSGNFPYASAAEPGTNDWADYINSGKQFSVVFDVANFDDSGWQGDSDPMGTLKAGETYAVTYDPAADNWTTTGYSEGKGEIISSGSKTISPLDGQLNLWGRGYKFNSSGEVTDYTYGLVGHLIKSSKSEIKFPIAELGNCTDNDSCRTYCDDSANKDACLAFAEKNNLMSGAEIEKAKSLPPTGPGGCRGKEECGSYCDSGEHADECISFAGKNNLLTPQELKKAKEFLNQAGPGGCKGSACKAYCEDAQHQSECVDFAIQNGLISGDQAKLAKKVLSEGGPGGCKSKEECDNFCNSGQNSEACLSFAESNGMISKEDGAMARKLGFGGGPGGCKGQECKVYCENPDNADACFSYAVDKGLIPKEEAEMAKKVLNKTGPGGCKGQECRVYCESEDHADECLAFAEKEGLIPADKIAEAKKFRDLSKEPGPGGCKGNKCRDYCADPQNQDECVNFAKAKGIISPKDLEKIDLGKKLEASLKEKDGPGGCKTKEDCQAYCSNSENSSECVAFISGTGLISSDKAVEMLSEFQKMKDGIPGNPADMMKFGPPKDFGGMGGSANGMPEDFQKKMEQFKQMESKFRSGGFPGGDAKSGPPSQEEIQKMMEGGRINMPVRPDSGGDVKSFPPSGEFVPPAGFEGRGAAPSAEEIQKMMQKNIPEGYGPPPGFNPPAGMIPPQGMMPQNIPDIPQGFSPSSGDMQKIQEQYQQQYQQSQPQQYQQQYQ